MLRSLEPRDYAQIEQIHLKYQPTPWSVSGLYEELELTLNNSYVFEGENGDILGFVLVRSVGHDSEITSMAVKENARRRGLGKLLIEVVAKKKKSHRVLLEVSTNNQGALALYKSCGFKEGRVRKAYYSDGSDALEMCLEIV